LLPIRRATTRCGRSRGRRRGATGDCCALVAAARGSATDPLDGARLWTPVAGLFDEADAIARAPVVTSIDQRVLVAVRLAAVARYEEPARAARLVEQPGDVTRQRRHVVLHVAPHQPGSIHRLAPRRAEGVADGDVDLGVAVVLRR